MAGKTYEGRYQREISFPLGGIGAGSVGLAGNGRLIDWEIFNRPNRQSVNGYTNFAIKAECDGEVLDARLVQGDTVYDFGGGMHVGYHSWGYGHGPSRATLAGLKHFEKCKFEAFYPIAEIDFGDAAFPGNVTMRAFNPFIRLPFSNSKRRIRRIKICIIRWLFRFITRCTLRPSTAISIAEISAEFR